MSERQTSGGSKGLGTKRALSVWLTEEDIEALKRIAHERGIGHTTLVRMWVREKLKELTPGSKG
jgi:predicted DNA binding CopG/RHH family protein